MLNQCQLLANNLQLSVIADHRVTLTIPLLDSSGQPNSAHHFRFTREKNFVQSSCRGDPGLTGKTSMLYSLFTRRVDTRLYRYGFKSAVVSQFSGKTKIR